MKVIHISERENRDSILKHGILPSKITLDHHIEYLIESEIIEEDENKAAYFWIDSLKNEKYIKDMIYCKLWIHPRNRIYTPFLEEHDGDIFDYSTLNRFWITRDNSLFDIYVADVDDWERDIPHSQEPNQYKYSSLYQMNEKFAHDDKQLYITNKPVKNIEIVGTVLFNADMANNTYNFKFSRC